MYIKHPASSLVAKTSYFVKSSTGMDKSVFDLSDSKAQFGFSLVRGACETITSAILA
jgi:hypothetical protein